MKSMDGVKLEDVFKESNGYGPRDDRPKPAPAPAAEPAQVSQPTGVVDEVISSDDTKKAEREQPRRSVKLKSPKAPKKFSKKLVLIIVAGLVFLGAIGFGIWQFVENQKLRDPSYIAEEQQKQTNDLVATVSKLIQLPEGTPTVATVTDITKLQDQPFFAKAQNGDKVLIYSESSTAVIYRASENRIINSGPIAITSEDPAAAEATPTDEQVTGIPQQ